MKKLFILTFLITGTLSFANTGKVVSPIKKLKATVACCSVGNVKVCGRADEPLCDRARAIYCLVSGACAPTNQD